MGETLVVANHLKLKGIANYGYWRQALEAASQGHGLEQYYRKKARIPKGVDEDDEGTDEKELELWEKWKAGDGKAKTLIINSVFQEPMSIIKGKKTALEMWEALEHQYKGTGKVLSYTYIEDYVQINFNQFNDIHKVPLSIH